MNTILAAREFKQASRRDEVLDFAAEIKAEDVHLNGVFKGYASTFGGEKDSGGDIIAKGCFTRTLKQKGRNGNGIAMLWSHDAKCPIGVWNVIAEDEKGLYVEGQVEPTAAPGGIPVYPIMKKGGIKGLSIGYNTVKAVTDEKKNARILQDVDLWEISLVTFPMNTHSTITGVKNIFEARTERELEDALREANMSRDAAKYLVRLCKEGLRDAGARTHADAGAGSGDWEAVAEQLRQINADLTVGAIKHAVAENF